MRVLLWWCAGVFVCSVVFVGKWYWLLVGCDGVLCLDCGGEGGMVGDSVMFDIETKAIILRYSSLMLNVHLLEVLGGGPPREVDGAEVVQLRV